MSTHARRTLLVLAALVLTATPGAGPAQATSYGGPVARDYMRTELVRMINAERAHRGLNRLALDTFLANKAQDSDIACPNDKTKLNAGRAHSLAVQNLVPPPHALPKCPRYTVLSVLPSWGYSSLRGEILTLNNNSTARARYDIGCPTGSGLTCARSNYTYAPETAATAMRQWMNSSGHRGNILSSSYTRVGCGAWQGGTASWGGYQFPNARWYSCIFARGGPTGRTDGVAPTVASPTLNGATYSAGMSVGGTVTVSVALGDSGGRFPRLADWWAYLDGNPARELATFREGAFDSAGATANISFSLGALSAGNHTLTIVVRDLATRQTERTFTLKYGG